MKTISTFFLRVMPVLFWLLGVQSGQAQCTASFIYTVGPNGTVSFTSTSTNLQPNTIYTWNFGNGSVISSTNLAQTAASYSANGSYVVSLTISSTNSLCLSTSTLIVNVGTALPNCSVSINYTPASSPTMCNGTASVTNLSGLCGTITYTWSTGASSPAAFNLCPGTYSVLIAGTTTGSFCCPSIMGIVTISATTCSLNANFVHSQLNNGVVHFTNTSTGAGPGTSYSWKFGDGSPLSPLVSPAHTYSANGSYTAVLTATNNAGCVDSTAITVLVNSYTCNANFAYSANTNGHVTFTSTSLGSNPQTSYFWNFGNGATYANTGPAGMTASHTYTAGGTYSVTLTYTTSGCTSSLMLPVSVTVAPCTLTANFSYTTAPNSATFVSTSTGTTPGTSYFWSYGDAGTGIGPTSSHVYAVPGVYVVTLTANNHYSPACVSTKTMAVSIYSVCSLSADFTHTVGLGGVVSFVNTSTVSANTCYWSFGDGVSSTSCNPSHAYSNAGAYLVKLFVNDTGAGCQDSITKAVNITGVPCVANSNFTLIPTSTPQYWNAIPAYPWNVTAASWSWGDGSGSNSLYTSHLYSASAMYSICLSVTVSCGASSTSCMSYSVYRSAETNTNTIININVISPGIHNGIAELNGDLMYQVYPNPNDGEFNLNFIGLSGDKVGITVFNLTGEIVYNNEGPVTESDLVKTVNLKNMAGGIYFVRVSSGARTFTQKIVISN